MSVRHVFLASVCAAFLAASAAVSGPAAAAQNPSASLAQQAYKALSAGDNEAAIAAYTQAIESRELEPEVLANALLNRALGYQNLGQHPQAIDDYTTALKLDAMSPKLRAMALYNRALSYQKVQRPALAIEDYTGALFLDATFSYAYYGRANLLRDSGQYLFALTDYEKALRYEHPDPARVYYNMAMTYEWLQRPQDERAALTKALAANPSYQQAKTKLASLDNGGIVLAAAASPVLGSQGGTLVARKQTLPAPEQPSASLLGEEVAPADTTASVSDPVETASATPTKLKKIQDRAPAQEETTAVEQPAGEKVIAEEPVTDETVASLDSEAPAAEPEQAASDTPKQSGWSVQIASAASEDAAWSTWKKMQKNHKVLRDKDPIVVKADLGTKGIFYRVRLTGYERQDDAKSACSKLKSGGVSCYVSKADS